MTSIGGFLDEPVGYEPFYSMRHARQGESPRTYWYSTRRPSQEKDDPGTEVYLSFVDPGFNPRLPASETITVHVTCTNRDLPSRLPFGGEQGDFELEGQGPVSRVRCLRKPTRPLRPPLGRNAQWRLISLLSLNHLSLADNEQGLDALREILMIYDFADSAVTRQQIAGMTGVSSRRVAGRTGRKIGNAVCLGVEVTRRVRRDPVRRQRRLPDGQRPGAIPGPVCVDQLVHPAGRQDATARRNLETMATPSRRTDPPLDQDALRGTVSVRLLPGRPAPGPAQPRPRARSAAKGRPAARSSGS